MKLSILASGSSGNCYIIQSKTEALILEAGVKLVAIRYMLRYNSRRVLGCLITHSHGDHSKYCNSYERIFRTFAPVHTIRQYKLNRTTPIREMKQFNIGRFSILPFRAEHDMPCVGYIIEHPDMGKLMFLTDSYKCEYSFEGLNHILIECNYSDNALREAMRKGITNSYLAKRLKTSHMELKTTCKVLSNQDLENVRNIVLIHLSKRNADQKEILDTVSDHTGKRVIIAKRGIEINLSMK